jgi:hypothetical protein
MRSKASPPKKSNVMGRWAKAELKRLQKK